jgi:hypothetical protein
MTWNDEKTAKPFEIDDRMLDLYARIRTLKCVCPPPPPDARYWEVPDDCPPCETFASLNHELARLFRLPCYEVYCVPPPHGEGFLTEQEEARRAAFEQALAEREGKTPRYGTIFLR